MLGRSDQWAQGMGKLLGGDLVAICQQLLEHAAEGLHAGRVVLVELSWELVLQAADQLIYSLLVSGKTALQGELALVQKGAQVVDAAVKQLL